MGATSNLVKKGNMGRLVVQSPVGVEKLVEVWTHFRSICSI